MSLRKFGPGPPASARPTKEAGAALSTHRPTSAAGPSLRLPPPPLTATTTAWPTHGKPPTVSTQKIPTTAPETATAMATRMSRNT